MPSKNQHPLESNWERIRANIFPAAIPSTEPWRDFPWHSGADQIHSSQALAIDVFGTLQVSGTKNAALCALTAKVIHYWKHIPEVFSFAANQDADGPFAIAREIQSKT